MHVKEYFFSEIECYSIILKYYAKLQQAVIGKNQVNKNLNLEKYQNKAYKHFYFNLNMIKTIVRIVSIMGIKYFPTMIISGIKSTLKILKNEN